MARRLCLEGVEHRREALDRLLPTIRAVADPITRELYLSLAAERAGVSKDVLEQELAEGGQAGTREPPAGGDRERSRQSRDTTPRLRGRRNPETQLLAACLPLPS